MSELKTASDVMAALENRTESKSTDKLIAIMAGLMNVPWEKVESVTINWDSLDLDDETQALPTLNIQMKK